MTLQLKAPAKINWFLHVGELREDGYHEICSLMQKLNLYDEISIAPSDHLIVECNIPIEENLCLKAALRLKEITDFSGGAIIKIKKNIPLGAGLGGGSSDAATVLLGLDNLWGLKLSEMELIHIGESLGSDIPFFINGPSAIVKGKGAHIEKVKLEESRVLLLVKPALSISSQWAYRELDRLRIHNPGLRGQFSGFKLEIPGLSLEPQDFRNDLEEPVFRRYPLLKEIKHRLLEGGAIYAAMTGSGSTIFGVFENPTQALKTTLLFNDMWCKVVETII